MSEKPAPGRFEEMLQEFTNYAVEVRGSWADFDGRDLLRLWGDVREKLRAAHAAEVEQAMNRAEYRIGVLLSDKRDLENKLAESRAAGVAEGYRKGFHAAAKEMFCRECTGGMQTLSAARAEGRRAMAREHLAKHLSLGCSEAAHKEDVCEERRWLESQAREGEKETE